MSNPTNPACTESGGVYYLDLADTTYTLLRDVSTPGTAFVVVANGVTFDLDGFTITYNNATPILVPNGSFEQGTGSVATDWDFSSAPSASRHAGVFLDNEVYDGDYSLKFDLPNSDQFVSSTSTITLEANTTYSLSAMLEYGGKGVAGNPGVEGFVRLVGTGVPTIKVAKSTTNWRGIQHVEQEFTTGATAATYTIEAGVAGGSGVNPTAYYIDDIKLQRTKTYGVAVTARAADAAQYPGVTQYGEGTNATIQNGVIVQGADEATFSHGVYIHDTTGVTVDLLNITVAGANSSAVMGSGNFTNPVVIQNSTFTSNVQTVSFLGGYDGAVVRGIVGTFQDNAIENGPFAGFVTDGNGSPSIISGNTIRLKAKYRDSFAIIATDSSQIFGNIIDNGSGEFTSQGIDVPSGTAGNITRVYNNTVRVQELPNKQEHEGKIITGAYGIQIESSSHAEVYGNEVDANAVSHRAFALLMNNGSGYTPENIHVHDNTFTSDGPESVAIKLTNVSAGLLFEDNTLETNNTIVGETTDTTIELIRTRIVVSNPVADPDVFTTTFAGGSGLHSHLSFVDTVFEDVGSRAHFDNGVVTFLGNDINYRMAASSLWTTTIQTNDGGGNPVSVAVTVEDKDSNQVASGTTDGSGQLELVIQEFQVTGDTKATYNDHTALAGNVSQIFTADQVQTVTLAGVLPPSAFSPWFLPINRTL